MQVKRSGGRVYGAVFTAAEQKALDMEIDRQLADMAQQYKDEVTARVLWVLRQEFGFSEKRLKQFVGVFDKSLADLVQYYQMEEKDCTWLCQQKLKDAGIDYMSWDSRIEKMMPDEKST